MFQHLSLLAFAAILALYSEYGHAVSQSKISIFAGGGDQVWQFFNGTLPRTLKIFDNFGEFPIQVKEISPETIIVGRIYIDNQPMDGNATQRAQQWWEQVNSTILSNPSVDYWEGYNEVVGGGDTEDIYQQMIWYSNMEISRMQIMSEHGVKAVIGNFATGCPDVTNATMINAFLPAIKAAKEQYNGILGLHEYSAPWLWTCFNGTVENGTGWLTGRYRKLYNEFLIPNDISIPLVLTEMGIDGQVGCNPTQYAGGWQEFTGYWADNGGVSDGNQEYTDQLIWYDSLNLVDDYVLGSFIFCVDIPGSQWDSFELNSDVINDLMAYMNSPNLTETHEIVHKRIGKLYNHHNKYLPFISK